MLSVIIYKKTSQAFIDRYRSLFEPYLDARKIAFCFWDDTGADMNSALPELKGIVRGVKQWRAIVVVPISSQENENKEYEYKEDNPFDYLCNENKGDKVIESAIPIIRLAQMLGGIPLVHKHFSYEIHNSNEQRQKLSLNRRESELDLKEQQILWNSLNDKYSFNCERPVQLYLFVARIPKEIRIPTVSDREICNRYESDSSLFWYRNRYPAMARFLTQDCSGYGNAHYHEDLFAFWMTTLTLALNEMPTGTFEAYKLYNVKAVIQRDDVHKLFSEYYNRLDNVRFSANKQIIEIKKSTQYTRELEDLPLYKADIPVEFKFTEDKDLHVSSGRIGLAGDCPIKEESWWYDAVKKSNLALGRLLKSTRRTLDRACSAARFSSKVLEEEIYDLDEYQYEDMNEQLSEIEKELLTFNTYKIMPIKKYKKELERAKKSAATSMRKRMSRKVTILSALFAFLVYYIGFIPDFVYQIREGRELLPIFGVAALGCLVMAIASLVSIFVFRLIIKMKISDYNGIVSMIVASIYDAGKGFSLYLSMCCSYMRGRSMLQTLEKRAQVSNEGIIILARHVERLLSQMQIIKNWLTDFDLKPLPDTGELIRTEFDFDIPPDKNKEYFIQTKNMNLNITLEDGGEIEVPYPFVSQFVVKRERIYEKNMMKKGENEDE